MKTVKFEPLDVGQVKGQVIDYANHHQIENHKQYQLTINEHQRDITFDRIQQPNRYQITIDAIINEHMISPAIITQVELPINNKTQYRSVDHLGTHSNPTHPSPVYVTKRQLLRGTKLHRWGKDIQSLITNLPSKGDVTYYSDHYLDEHFFEDVYALARKQDATLNDKQLIKLKKYSDRIYNHYAISEDKIPDNAFIYR